MSYTVGVKRRFWFGFRKIKVDAHDWQHGRFILNRSDGAQEHIPGFSVQVLRVYADFWTHLHQLNRGRQAAAPVPTMAPEPVAQVIAEPVAVPEEAEPVRPPNTQQLEAQRRAAERVRDILDGAH